jgi:hypothetical protein
MAHVYRELNITAIYSKDREGWSLWLSELNGEGDWEIKGFCDATHLRAFDDFSYLWKQCVTRSDPIPSRKRFKKRRSP